MTIYVKRKNGKILSQIWTQKFRYYCPFRELFEIFVGLCRNILHKKGVLASKSHRGRHEHMWQQSGNNFERKKKFWFFWWFLSSEISKKCHFICPKNGFPPTLRWCKKFLRGAMKTNKNSCESWDIGLSNAPTLVSIRPLEKSVGHFSKKNGLFSTL